MARKKKRGVKPGTKRGPYKKTKLRALKAKITTWKGEPITLAQMDASMQPKAYTPSPVLTLCGQLEDSILLLEQRISNAIAKINSLM